MSDVLYLETDEDITSAVEKLVASKADDVQVVVPKRSTLLASMINLKLLKKAADQHKKNLVLVTTDRLSTHLAGRVGLPVATKLGAEANVPEAEVKEPEASEVIDGGVEETGKAEEATAALAAAGAGAAVAKAKADDDPAAEPKSQAADDTMPLPGEKTESAKAGPVMTTKPVGDKADSKPKSKAKTHVPDFNAMQRKVMWGGIAVAVVVGLFILNFLLAHASVTIFAKGSSVPANATFVANPTVSSSDLNGGVLKAQTLTSSKDLSEQVAATGTQDVGTKASGSVTIKNCEDSSAHSLPAGATVSSGGLSFVTNAAVSIPGGSFSNGGKVCSTAQSATVGVTSAANGDKYNLAPASYTSPSLTSNFIIQGTQMSGGTTKTVKVVQQSDIDGAVADLLGKDKDGAQKDLAGQAASGNQMINETFTQTPANISPDTPVGNQADNVTVKVTAKYDALAISSSDLDKLLKADIAKQVGPNNQVYDSGAGSAKFQVQKKNTDGSQNLSVTASGSAGPKLDTAQIAKDLRGKKYGDANDMLNNMKGVDHAVITISPSWNTRMPSRASKIKVQIKVSGASG